MNETLSIFMDNYGYNLIATCVVAFLGVQIIRNILRLLKKGLLESKLDRSLIGFVVTLVKICLYLALLFYCLGRMNIPLTGIVSALSAITLAIGLAVQDIIAGAATGLMLVSSSLFKVNDYVEIGSIAGSVKEIKLLHTVLVTPDNKTITIPNKTVFGSQITNYSSFKMRRIDAVFGIDYDADVEIAKKALLGMATSNPKVLKEPAPVVKVKNLSDSSVDILVRVWVESSNYWDVTWAFNEQALSTLKKVGVEIPYNHMTITYKDGGKA
ncbi:MAG: mechanosensitive ion channel family protein [Spirochaetales bacterium]|nr:mechanosensitive ion channel family protein [Candidatus Physcosoma equi]